MERILCPVDLKPDTLNSLEAAAHFAAAHKAQLVLLHVFTKRAYELALDEYDGDLSKVDALQEQQQLSMDKLCETMRQMVPNLNCTTMLRNGSAINIILEEAKNLKANLIVMGSHGVHDITEAMDGNHPVKVIERSPCPVLCMPEGASFALPAKVVYGSRMKAEDPDCLQRLIAMLHPFKSRIEVVYVGDEGSGSKEKWQAHEKLIRSYVAYDKMRFHYFPWKEDVHRGLDEFMLQIEGELLVLLTHQRNFLLRLFEKSVFKELTYFSDFPVLVYLEDHLTKASREF